jgi:signal peptidase II
MKNKVSYFLLAVGVLAADQLTKAWAVAKLKPVVLTEVIPGYFRLIYATNRGVAFSLFADGDFDARWVFAAISVVAALFVFGYLIRTSPTKVRLNTALALLLAGIVGNLIDRVRMGEVVDFLGFHIHDKYSWPIFNLADSAICIGAVLLALEMLFEERPIKNEPDGPAPIAEERTQPES